MAGDDDIKKIMTIIFTHTPSIKCSPMIILLKLIMDGQNQLNLKKRIRNQHYKFKYIIKGSFKLTMTAGLQISL